MDYAEAVSGWQETVTTYRTNVVPRSCTPKSKAYSKSSRLNYHHKSYPFTLCLLRPKNGIQDMLFTPCGGQFRKVMQLILLYR